jgi:ABC-type lipoprotein export system ATPase subunit
MNKEFIYKIKDLSFNYQLGKQTAEVLTSLTFNIPSQSLVTISGPSGSGKSTLLNILGLIEPVQTGTVELQGESLSQMSERRKNELRRYEIGFVFQQFHLIPVLNAEENIRYFLTKQKLSRTEINERIEESLSAVGLLEHRLKKPSQLSGGQKQRVAIARAIAKHPTVLIGDEPTASLDRKTGKEIIELLSSLVQTKKTSVILTTHDTMVQSYASCNFHLEEGTI